jgi:hypothetical protein
MDPRSSCMGHMRLDARVLKGRRWKRELEPEMCKTTERDGDGGRVSVACPIATGDSVVYLRPPAPLAALSPFFHCQTSDSQETLSDNDASADDEDRPSTHESIKSVEFSSPLQQIFNSNEHPMRVE